MGEVIHIHERRAGDQLAALSQKVDLLSGNIGRLIAMTDQRLRLVDNLIQAINDPEVGEKLSEQRQSLLKALVDVKTSLEAHLADMKRLATE